MKTIKDYHKIIFDTTPAPMRRKNPHNIIYDMCVLSWLMLYQHNYS